MANFKEISPIVGTKYNDVLSGGSGSEVLSGKAGDDVIHGNSGSDTVYGGRGDDIIQGNSGDDTLYGDSTTSYLDMSNLVISEDHDVTVTFEGESAGYRNSFGWYKIDPESGEIKDASFLWTNASLQYSGGDLISGASQKVLDVNAGDQVGFFIISNGFSHNNSFFTEWDGSGDFTFLDPTGAVATLESINPSLIHTSEKGAVTELLYHDYHTAAYGETLGLNPDGILHTVGELDVDQGTLTLGFEDLYNGGDRDFDDTVFTIDIGQANAQILNAHSSYGSEGFQLDGGNVSRVSDARDDLTLADQEMSEENLWDIRHVGITNDTANLTLKTDLYGTTIPFSMGQVATLTHFIDSQSSDVNNPNWDYAIKVEMSENSILVDLYSIEGGNVAEEAIATGTGTYFGNQIIANISMESLSMDIGNDLVWTSQLTSNDNVNSATDYYNQTSTYEISSFNDTIVGGSGADQIYGQKGDDNLSGGDGHDIIFGGAGSDTLLGGAYMDELNGGSGEDILNGGSGNDDLWGGSGKDTLDGGSGADILQGRAGDDFILGGGGHDTLYGGSGDDFLLGGSGNDVYVGGSGNDTASFSLSGKRVIGNLKTRDASGEGNDSFDGIENIIGSGFGDKLTGNHLANELSGMDGDDRLYGRKGDDTLDGGEGNDYMDGGSGDDILSGGAGNDELKGYKGDDQLSGGEGSDVFVFRSVNEGHDTITDFTDEDYLDVSKILSDAGFDEQEDQFSDFIRTIDDGNGNVEVQVDTSGSGANWSYSITTLDDNTTESFTSSHFIMT